MNFAYENQFKFLSELQKETYCLKTVDNIINAVGQQEVLVCLKEKDHKGRCSHFINCEKIKNNSTLSEKDKNKLIDKIHLLSYNTAGETANNSPIKNRSSRWRDRPISMKEQSQLKKESQFRIGIRKDEFSTAAYCQVISIELYESVVNILNKNKEHNTKCYLCKEELTIENFICSERKNPNSIQGCHLQPLREDAMMHKPGNVKWGHRHCNLIQNDNSLEETLQKIKIILKNNDII